MFKAKGKALYAAPNAFDIRLHGLFVPYKIRQFVPQWRSDSGGGEPMDGEGRIMPEPIQSLPTKLWILAEWSGTSCNWY